MRTTHEFRDFELSCEKHIMALASTNTGTYLSSSSGPSGPLTRMFRQLSGPSGPRVTVPFFLTLPRALASALISFEKRCLILQSQLLLKNSHVHIAMLNNIAMPNIAMLNIYYSLNRYYYIVNHMRYQIHTYALHFFCFFKSSFIFFAFSCFLEVYPSLQGPS